MPRQLELSDLNDMLAGSEDDLGVQEFLDVMGAALTSGDDASAAALWDTPAYVLGSDTSFVIRAPNQLEVLFVAARERYSARGVIDTHPEIVRLDEINDRVVMVRVHWPWIDAKGREVGGETSTYTLQRNDDGEWKLRVVLMHGAEAVS
ncbi:MAG TPA: hypothetical protein VG943_14195 [Caulobacterales bacterium]|nr:hypothetical protein [Caulobacterales bacterium]